ncbi:hypothetical protein WJX72_005099 [[Myrmecia] bisecta]|uniref:Centrosomal protein POC5 n=1 Tax=[Myrmecia] bisecta TaxID=41462 RepID=A0AAW1Q241_9CHLO
MRTRCHCPADSARTRQQNLQGACVDQWRNTLVNKSWQSVLLTSSAASFWLGRLCPQRVERFHMDVTAAPGPAAAVEDAASAAQAEPLPISTSATADIDLDLLSVKLDEQARNNKTELLEFVLAFKSKLLREAEQQRTSELNSAGRTLAAKQAEVVALQDEVELQKRHAKQASGFLLRMACDLAQAKHFARHHRLLALAMYTWRNFTRYQKRIKDNMRAAVFHYDSTKLKKRVFVHWRSTANLEFRGRMRTEIAAQMMVARHAALAEASQQVAALQQALADAHAQLEAERDARTRTEEDTRRAFMRGVCALNIEAMAVMKRGGPNGAPLGAQPNGSSGSYPPMPAKPAPGSQNQDPQNLPQQHSQRIPSYRPPQGLDDPAAQTAAMPTHHTPSPKPAADSFTSHAHPEAGSVKCPVESGSPVGLPLPGHALTSATVTPQQLPQQAVASASYAGADPTQRSVIGSLLQTLSEAATPSNTPFTTLRRPGEAPAMPMPSQEVAGRQLLVSTGQGDLVLVSAPDPGADADTLVSEVVFPLRPPAPQRGVRTFTLEAAYQVSPGVIRCIMWAVRGKQGPHPARAEVFLVTLQQTAGNNNQSGAGLSVLASHMVKASPLPPHGALVSPAADGFVLVLHPGQERESAAVLLPPPAPRAGGGSDGEAEEAVSPRTLQQAAARLAQYTSEQPMDVDQAQLDPYREGGPLDVTPLAAEPECTIYAYTCQPGVPHPSSRRDSLLLGLTDDVDCALVRLACQADAAQHSEVRAEHVGYIPALAYIAAGKVQRKFVLLGALAANVAGAIMEGQKLVYLYKRTKAGQESGENQVVDMGLLEGGTGVLGAVLTEPAADGKSDLLVLTSHQLLVYHLN